MAKILIKLITFPQGLQSKKKASRRSAHPAKKFERLKPRGLDSACPFCSTFDWVEYFKNVSLELNRSVYCQKFIYLIQRKLNVTVCTTKHCEHICLKFKTPTINQTIYLLLVLAPLLVLSMNQFPTFRQVALLPVDNVRKMVLGEPSGRLISLTKSVRARCTTPPPLLIIFFCHCFFRKT